MLLRFATQPTFDLDFRIYLVQHWLTKNNETL